MLQEVAYTINSLQNWGTNLTPFHIMHGTEPTPNSRRNTNERQPRMAPGSWYEEASHVVSSQSNPARTNLQIYNIPLGGL